MPVNKVTAKKSTHVICRLQGKASGMASWLNDSWIPKVEKGDCSDGEEMGPPPTPTQKIFTPFCGYWNAGTEDIDTKPYNLHQTTARMSSATGVTELPLLSTGTSYFTNNCQFLFFNKIIMKHGSLREPMRCCVICVNGLFHTKKFCETTIQKVCQTSFQLPSPLNQRSCVTG